MTYLDKQILFASLGFVTLLIRGDIGDKEGARRAKGLSWLIEEYCRDTIPGAFDNSLGQSEVEFIDGQLDTYKDALRRNEAIKIDEDRKTLLHMHKRVEERRRDIGRYDLSNEILQDHLKQMLLLEVEEEQQHS